ncbi:zinc finger protein 692-like [Dipodomys spectabilis]|uniref:zinc finger protein 692-like n=1 Tax=Dipodomys spectabilis TaxID=105255 RepID=UPI001C5499FF|nr:zinc finger protein 692-like [Dipodomys spectabilis]
MASPGADAVPRAAAGEAGGSWTRAAARAACAWAATRSAGAASRSGWASRCTRSWPPSCWTGLPLQAASSVQVPSPGPHQGLQGLVLLSHAHSRECSLVPGLRGPRGRDGGLVWECSAGHTFYLGAHSPPCVPGSVHRVHAGPRPRARRPGGAASRQVWGLSKRELKKPNCPGGQDPQQSPSRPLERNKMRKMRMMEMKRRCSAMPARGPTAPPQMTVNQMSAGHPRAPAGSPAEAPEALPTPLAGCSSPALAAGSGVDVSRTPLTAGQTEPLASPGSRARSAPARDQDTAQIGPKRIRKAARRELMPCDFPGCGRIFSNRQYLNHHKKYQHLHQKSFCCPEPACGKSFNFKKHLKEHVKLHSDTRDYICEFCARSFRTSSNLVIHRRIHTGEKPLQCEICGFTCRQKASLNWHRRKHAETAATLRFPCDFCGKRFEKPGSVAAHCSKSHPALLPAAPESPNRL